jgi:hypothetical protein
MINIPGIKNSQIINGDSTQNFINKSLLLIINVASNTINKAFVITLMKKWNRENWRFMVVLTIRPVI